MWAEVRDSGEIAGNKVNVIHIRTNRSFYVLRQSFPPLPIPFPTIPFHPLHFPADLSHYSALSVTELWGALAVPRGE